MDIHCRVCSILPMLEPNVSPLADLGSTLPIYELSSSSDKMRQVLSSMKTNVSHASICKRKKHTYNTHVLDQIMILLLHQNLHIYQ